MFVCTKQQRYMLGFYSFSLEYIKWLCFRDCFLFCFISFLRLLITVTIAANMETTLPSTYQLKGLRHLYHLSRFHQFSSVQSLSHVWLFATPWIAAHQASLSIITSRRLLKLMPIESVMPSSHLTLCCPLLLLPPIPPNIRVFSNESSLAWDGQSIRVSASASVLPMNTQDWFPLRWTGWISLQSKGRSRVFSNTTVQKHQFFGTHLSI